MKRQRFLLLPIIIVLLASGIIVYERTAFDIKSFSFEPENSIHDSCVHEKMEPVSGEVFSRMEMEKMLTNFGVSSYWVKDLSMEELTNYVRAQNIDKCTSFLKIMKNGNIEEVMPEEALNENEVSTCMYLQKNVFLFTLNDKAGFDRHCIVVEMDWLTEIKWACKYELAVGVLRSSFDMDTVKCRVYKSDHGTVECLDLRDKVNPVGDAGYLGIRIVDDLQIDSNKGTLLTAQYEFSIINYIGDLLHYTAQFHCKRSVDI